jgi:hypothetical protein
MIKTPTVFVLGAGASMPYGFPSGDTLAADICQANRDRLEPFGVGPKEYEEFAKQLRASDQASVDAFLEHRQKFIKVGKLAIAFHLIGCEATGRLQYPHRDWYTWLLNRMTAAAPFENFNENKVSFITFNYDRSLEHYLFTALSARYGKSNEEIAKALNGFPFVHVHGRMGYLPWQKSDTETGKPREYNTEPTPEAVAVAADGIKIISENIDDSPEFEKARQLMSGAMRIGILGFGFHPVNMRRLRIPFSPNTVYGSCKGFTPVQSAHLMKVYPGLALEGYNAHDFLCNRLEFQAD